MRREAAKKHADVIKAFIDGADVQFLDSEGHWRDDSHPSFIGGVEYRVKPNPMELWFVVNGENNAIGLFTAREPAEKFLRGSTIIGGRIIHLKEVV